MKMKKVTIKQPWTADHVNELCHVYAGFLAAQMAGGKVVKKHINVALAERQGRSLGSVECKLMNISAVFDMAGRDWVAGYKPLPNINRELIDQVCSFFKLEV